MEISEERVYSLNTVNVVAHICIYIFFNLNKRFTNTCPNPVMYLLKPNRQVRFVL